MTAAVSNPDVLQAPALAALLQLEAKPSLCEGERVAEGCERLAKTGLNELFAPYSIADRDAARAVEAALYLRFNAIHQSHDISQGIDTIEGSVWHAVMHRREGDYWNSKYWLRQAGRHPAYLSLAAVIEADPVSRTSEIGALIERGSWHPSAFVDLCEKAARLDSPLTRAGERVQELEWQELFTYCFVRAVLPQG